MWIDTHAHLDFPEFQNDLSAVIARALEAGVDRIISIGTSLEGSERALAIAEQFPNVWAAVGVHPCSADEAPDDLRPALRKLAAHPRAVAIGEIGLDFYHLPGDQSPEGLARWKAKQDQAFRQQLEVAREFSLNVVIHQRNSWEETVAVLEQMHGGYQAVYHCFGGTPAQAGQVLALGHLVSFTGIVTFKNAATVQESATHVPIDRFMVETDCPYLAPVPFRGKPCEPAHVRFTGEKIASLRGISPAQLAAETTATAERFFPKIAAR